MSIVFGSKEANEIRQLDIARGALSDCKDYGGTAPRPVWDAKGRWIDYEDDGAGEGSGLGDQWTPYALAQGRGSEK